MKRSLLFAIFLLCVFIVNAQKHIATALPAKKTSGVGKHSLTQKPTAACDTLKLDSANSWSPFYYTFGSRGYVFGTGNLSPETGFTVNEDANYYDVSGSDDNYITGGLALFATANSNKNGDLAKNLIFRVYADDGTGIPGNLLGSTTLKLSQVKNDVDNNLLTEFIFANPIPIPANKIFYVSIDHSNFTWGGGTRDSIAIIADSSGQAPAAAYQNLTLTTGESGWIPVNQLWSNPDQTSLDANLFLFPYVSNTTTGCTLPVSIINFKGSLNDNKALLTWSTATEFNNKGFAIERSKDGKIFTQVGFINGAGTTTQRKDYSYTDATLSDFNIATIYYRLRQVDIDGKTSYSNVIPLSLKDIVNWKLYPNPVKDKLTIELNLTADAKVSVQIISKDGKLLLNADKGTILQGQQQLNLNIQNLASGSYFVRVKAGDKVYTQSIVKQ